MIIVNRRFWCKPLPIRAEVDGKRQGTNNTALSSWLREINNICIGRWLGVAPWEHFYCHGSHWGIWSKKSLYALNFQLFHWTANEQIFASLFWSPSFKRCCTGLTRIHDKRLKCGLINIGLLLYAGFEVALIKQPLHAHPHDICSSQGQKQHWLGHEGRGRRRGEEK